MLTVNPLMDADKVGSFLDGFDQATAARGAAYFNRGAVVALTSPRPGAVYSAVVRGTQAYKVTLLFEGDGWDGHCTCPVGNACKHQYAAMLAFEERADQFLSVAPVLQGRRPTGPSPSREAQREPALPPSPLVKRVTAGLGRKPTGREADYLRTVQALFRKVSQGGGPLMPFDLYTLAPGADDFSRGAVDLWRSPPRDDHELWLYCAWYLRNRGLSGPPFLQDVTDFTPIEAEMKEWEREKAVKLWRGRLAQARRRNADAILSPVDLRLMLLPKEAVVEARSSAEEAFQEIKAPQFRRFREEFEKGSRTLHPEAAPLWMTLRYLYMNLGRTRIAYGSPESTPLLNEILRLPALSSRVVDGQGATCPRPVEPLRYELRESGDEAGDYRLRLTRADGSTPGAIWHILAGRPTLYLAEGALYEGPPPHGLGPGADMVIPAPAIECAEGVTFIDSLGLKLPTRLATRTRRVSVKVDVYADIESIHHSSDKQVVALSVLASQDGDVFERFQGDEWKAPPSTTATRAKRAASASSIPLFDRAAQHHFPSLLETLGAKWDAYADTWRVGLSKKFPEKFVTWLSALPEGVTVHLDPELATLRDAPVVGSVKLDIKEAGVDWFDLKIVLDIADTRLTAEELKLLLNARGGYVHLGRNGWRRLQFDLTEDDDNQLARLGLDARDFTAEPQRLHALQLADEAAKKFLPGKQADAIARRARDLKARVNPKTPASIRATLRPYQIEGFHFLAYLTANRFGGVLADDMGLGKTIQALTWLAWLRERPQAGKSGSHPSLVVCPKSVMDNWQAEALRFLPGLRVRLWRGEDAKALAQARRETDLVVIHYAQLRNLSPEVTEAPWQAVILDEAQSIKNPDSQTAQLARALKADHRLALTGTPIENRLLDLWSILAFAMPGVLGNRAQFVKNFGGASDPLARRRLAARVRPFLLRRTKQQVAKDLPDRIEEDLFCEMEAQQKTLYRAEFKRAQQILLKIRTRKELNASRFNLLTSLLRLRQICCHPGLVNPEMRQAESAKLNALMDLLEPLMEEGHKVLVFSQFVTMLELVRESVRARAWPYFYLAGDTENRGDLVKEFHATEGAAVFLISLKAGGFGLNLTAASYVVLFDPWWNPAVEAQAIDRTHRIGQTSKVIAYRLLMKDSIEEKIRALQKTKATLAEDVLGEEAFARSLTLEDLKQLFTEE